MGLRLFLGLFFIFLIFWKGDGGYLDLREYLDDAERLWLKRDLRLPAASEAPDAPRYNRYSLGLPILSGPFVLAGAAIERITKGAIGQRAVAGLTTPVLAALAGVLLFEIAVLLKASFSIALSVALIYCLGSPHLTYARFFYAEAAVECGLLLALWSYLKYFDAGPWPRIFWSLLAGVGLAAAGASHYAHAPLVASVWLCLAVGIYKASRPESDPGKVVWPRIAHVLLFALVPALSAGALMELNISRYGHLVPSGYQPEVAKISPDYIAGNLKFLGRMLLRTPWFAPALIFGIMALWREKTAKFKALACAMLIGVLAQQLFWMCYSQLPMFAARYLHPMSALAALGLPGLLQWLHRKLPSRGVAYALIALLLSNAVQFFGDTIFQPFMRTPPGAPGRDGLWVYAWYMQPILPGAKFDAGSPAGPIQYTVIAALLFCGIFALMDARASAQDNRYTFG